MLRGKGDGIKDWRPARHLLARVVKGPSILGRDLMAKFKLPWQNIFHMVSTTSEGIKSQYPNLFDNTTVGKLKGIQVPLRVKEANPVFIKPRVVCLLQFVPSTKKL